jgi:hypothetical protein
MSIKTTIDKVPVEFEIKSIGPASVEDIDKFREDLSAGKIIVVKKSQEPNPYLAPVFKDEGVLEVEEVVEPEVEVEPEIVPEPSPEVEVVKPWWMSKTIIANALTGVGCALATFLTENPDIEAYWPIAALAAINLVLRGISKEPIKLPFEGKIKNQTPKKAEK